MNKTHITPRGVKIPLGPIVAALDDAYAAGRASGADNRDADSPGGTKVTPGEVLEDLGAFFAALLAEATPGILEANGVEAQALD